jgi:hypothetical protein
MRMPAARDNDAFSTCVCLVSCLSPSLASPARVQPYSLRWKVRLKSIIYWFVVKEKYHSFAEKVRPINSSTKQSIISGVGFPRRQHPPRPAGWWTPHMDKQVQFYCWKHFVHVTVEFRIWLLHCITHHLLLLCNKAVTVDKFFGAHDICWLRGESGLNATRMR